MSTSTNNNLNATARRERALRALSTTHPAYLRTRKVRPGSPAARAIKVAIERHTHTVAEMHRIANAPMRDRLTAQDRLLMAIFGTTTPPCLDCGRRVMDTHACPNNDGFCVDCCRCPEHA